MHCNSCGRINREEAKFCSYCGCKLRGVTYEILLNRYKVLDIIKSGGMGVVYKAKDLKKEQIVALKVIYGTNRPAEDRERIKKRFIEEAKLIASLHHPNIPRVYAYFSFERNYYLVMEFIEGEDMESLIKKVKEGFPEKFVLEWGIQICEILEYLHSQQPPIIYRDLKPSNLILRTRDNRVFIIDFGIAKAIFPSLEIRLPSIGTEGFAPLEQYRGKADPRSDIYALGATLYYLLTGEVPIPFHFLPVRSLKPSISRELELILLKALQTEPQDRFESACEMKNALLTILNGEKIDIKIKTTETKNLEYIKKLLKDLDSEEKEQRLNASTKLIGVEDKSIIPVLIKLLEDADWNIRRNALIALTRLKAYEAFHYILKALDDPTEIVRTTAVEAIGKLGNKAGVRQLEKMYRVSVDRGIKSQIIEALGEIRDPETVPLIIEAVSDSYSGVRLRAVEALKKIKDQRAIPALKKALSDPFDYISRAAWNALKEIGKDNYYLDS